MKKICPYCGRVGELGTSCPGCGYVLQSSDETAPTSPAPSSTIEIVTTYQTFTSHTQSPAPTEQVLVKPPVSPPPAPVPSPSYTSHSYGESNKTASYTYKEPSSASAYKYSAQNPPPKAEPSPAARTLKNVFIVVIRIISIIVGIPLILLGTFSAFSEGLFEISFMFGICFIMFSAGFAAAGITMIASAFSKTREATLIKCLKYLMLPCIILCIVTFFLSIFIN